MNRAEQGTLRDTAADRREMRHRLAQEPRGLGEVSFGMGREAMRRRHRAVGPRFAFARAGLFGAIHLDALIRSGWNDAALKILQADDRERPTVPATKRALADLLRKLGRAEQAMTAEYEAERLARQYSASKGAAA